MRIGVIVLALTLITACLAGGTFAKYTSTYNGKATGSIAAWTWQIAGADAVEDFSVDILATTATANEYGQSTADEQIAAGKMAPGSQGSFKVAVVNNSEVTGKYTITFTVPTGSPVEIKTGDGEWGATAVAESNLGFDKTGNANSTEVTVEWRWAFERGADDEAKATNNTADTALAGTAFEITAKAVFEQVD